MDLREQRTQEHRHPWEVARSGFFRRLIHDHCATRPTAVIDIGAGDGWFAAQLRADLAAPASIICWDAHYTTVDLAEVQPVGISRTTVAPTQPAPLVTALDVLEHVLDDVSFVRDEVRRVVAEGGLLVVSVPAHPLLFTSHDTALGHHRRHTIRTLRALLEPHFEIVQSGSLFTSLLVPRALSALKERVRPPHGEPSTDSEWRHGRLLTSSVTAVLRVDAAIGRWCAKRRIPLPGLSVWAVCRPRGAQ